MSSSTQSKLIAISSKDNRHKPSKLSPTSFAKKMLHHPNPKEAAQIVGEQAGLEFDLRHGWEFEKRTLDQVDFNASYKASKKRESQLDAKLSNTKQYIKSCPEAGNDEEGSGKHSKWRFRDQVLMFFLIIALVIAMVMGAANVYANLMASGEVVFLEKPWLAISLSMLVPAGSTALKFISNFFEFDRTKKRYALVIYILCALSLLTWTICFAMNFTGIAGSEIDWDAMGEESSNSGVLLVWTQLFTEILAAAAIFLAVEDIYLKYSPDTYRENPDYINAKETLSQHRKEHEEFRERRGENHASLAKLKPEREVFINESIADYLALRARFNAVSNF